MTKAAEILRDEVLAHLRGGGLPTLRKVLGVRGRLVNGGPLRWTFEFATPAITEHNERTAGFKAEHRLPDTWVYCGWLL